MKKTFKDIKWIEGSSAGRVLAVGYLDLANGQQLSICKWKTRTYSLVYCDMTKVLSDEPDALIFDIDPTNPTTFEYLTESHLERVLDSIQIIVDQPPSGISLHAIFDLMERILRETPAKSTENYWHNCWLSLTDKLSDMS